MEALTKFINHFNTRILDRRELNRNFWNLAAVDKFILLQWFVFPIFCFTDFYAIYIFILHCSASHVVANKHSMVQNFYDIFSCSIKGNKTTLMNQMMCYFQFEECNKSRCLTQARFGPSMYLFVVKGGNTIKQKNGNKGTWHNLSNGDIKRRGQPSYQ